MKDFVLDARLAAGSVFVADWALCRVLLMDDAHYPWLVLVPRREGATEIFHLTMADRAAFIEEAAKAGKIVAAIPGIAKVNIGALGNLVPQLHLHVVGRSQTDAAWPGPVWGHGPPQPYEPGKQSEMIALISSY